MSSRRGAWTLGEGRGLWERGVGSERGMWALGEGHGLWERDVGSGRRTWALGKGHRFRERDVNSRWDMGSERGTEFLADPGRVVCSSLIS